MGDCEYSVLYGYENRRLSTITHNGFNYGFTYDGMGRTKEIKIADTVYSSNEYTLSDTTTVTTTYAGGEKMTVETDRHQQPIKRTYTDKNGKQIVLAESEYDSLGKIVKTVDKLSDLEYNYKYDGFDNVIEETHGATSISNTFDSNNRLVGVHVTLEDLDQNSAPIYDKTPEGNIYPDNAIVGISYNNNELVSTITKDVYGRTVGRDVILDDETQLVKERYGYYSSEKSDGNRLTSMINSITQSFGDGGAHTLFYDYDSNGNIINIYHDGTLIVHYTYDSMNQLVREDNAELIATPRG